ncbi:pentapeptide repeat-containing protein, partial [archaeon]|nr:pentapeptide repeat-containing protein [archaeon]
MYKKIKGIINEKTKIRPCAYLFRAHLEGANLKGANLRKAN